MNKAPTRRAPGPDDGFPRRTVLRSGVTLAAGSLAVGHGAVQSVAAATAENWPMQQFDTANTSHNSNGTPLETDPAVLFEHEVPPSIRGGYLLVGESLYIHTPGNRIGEVNVETGEKRVLFEAGDTSIVPEFVEGDTLVARSLGGTMYVLDRTSGEKREERRFGQGVGMGYAGNDRWFAPHHSGRVVAGEAGADEPRWEAQLEGAALRPAVSEGGVYVATIDAPPEELNFLHPEEMDAQGRLYALDLEEGSVAWTKTREQAGISPPAVRDGTVYWTGGDGSLRAYDADTGEQQWEFTADGGFYTSPAVTGGVVLAGSDDGNLYAIDAETGDEIGAFDAGGAVRTDPVVVGDTAFFGGDETAYALTVSDGTHLWEFDAGATVDAVTAGRNRVFVGTSDGLYVLGPDDAAASGSDATSGAADDDAATERQRGLFSNGGDDPEFVGDAVNLTVLGFLLSVVGIVHQMLGGR